MEKKLLFLAILCILFINKDVYCQNSEPENGMIVSVLPYSFLAPSYPGQLQSFSGDVDDLKINEETTAKPNVYKFNSPYTRVSSITPDTRNKTLYYIDMETKAMYRLSNANVSLSQSAIKEEVIHEGISNALGHVVFDWISGNLYWTDRYHNFISIRPANTNDTLMYRVILEEQIIVPISLAIDPASGLLFWSDTMPSRRIERSNLLGENRTVLLTTSISFPVSMVTDHNEQRIYWSDLLRNTVEYADYYGDQRQKLRRVNGLYIYGIAVFKEYLCATEQYLDALLCINKQDGKIAWGASIDGAAGPHAVTVYDKTTQPYSATNHCETVRCSHFCVSLAPERRARCVCKEGFYLLNDGVTCKESHILDKKGLLFTNGTKICILDIHAITNATHTPQCIDYSLNTTHLLQVDTQNGIIFFWNSSAREIKQFNTVTKSLSFVASTSASLSGMFYDWLEDTIFWSENDTNTIKRAHQRTLEFRIVYSNVQNVAYLVGNPHNKTLYWISGSGDSAILEGGTTSGGNRFTVLPSTKVKHPQHLYYDEIYEKLYWVNDEELQMVRTNGTEIETLMSVGKPTSILLYKDYIVWTTGDDDIKAAFIFDSSPETIISLTAHNKVMGVCVTDPKLQRQERGPCEDGNGGCQHICVPTQAGRECQCPYGLKIDKNDGKTCKSESLTTNFALITDPTQNRIYQVPLTNQFNANDIVAIDIPSVDQPHGAVYQSSSEFLYWGEINNQQIKRAKLTGENETTVYLFKDHFPDRLVFDDSTGNLYFTALSTRFGVVGYIGVLRLDPDPRNPKHKTLIPDLQEPRCLALYPSKGYLFWGEAGDTEFSMYIGRSNMDGTKAKPIITKGIYTPIGMTIDYKADRIYWADLIDDTIRSATLDGKDIKKFYEEAESHPAGLDIKGSFLYLISWNRGKITKININTGKEEQWMSEIAELGRLDSIQIIPPEPQPVSKYCSVSGRTEGCSTFCFPTQDSSVCGCEDGVKLRDKRHCDNVCSDFFEHVKISKECVIKPNGDCTYSCIGHLKKNKDIDHIRCFPNGTWDKPESLLCNETVCPSTLPDIRIARPCTATIGKTCNYMCNDQSMKKTYTVMRCSSGGVWVPNTNLCQAPVAVKCPEDIKNGKLEEGCSRLANNTECKFTCDDGIVSMGSMNTLVCHSTGEWSYDVNRICEQVAISGAAQSAEREAVALGAGLGAIILLMLLVLVVLMVCFLRKRETPKHLEQGSPQISQDIPKQRNERDCYSDFTNQGSSASEVAGGAYVTIGQQRQPSQQQPQQPSQQPSQHPSQQPSQQPTNGKKPDTYSEQPKHRTFINIAKGGGSAYERF